MDEKKFQFRVQEWFRQAAARYRNEIHRETEKNIILELETGNEIVETAEIVNYIQFNPTNLLQDEEQVQ